MSNSPNLKQPISTRMNGELNICFIISLLASLLVHISWQATLSVEIVFTLLALGTVAMGCKLRRQLRMIWRDTKHVYTGIKALKKMKYLEKNNFTLPKLFNELALEHPDKTMFLFEDERWTYSMVDEYSNRVANYFMSQGLCEGDNVALFAETCMEYIPLCLGLMKIGATISMINHNLTDKPLIHCLKSVHCMAIIYGYEVQNALDSIFGELPESKLYVLHQPINNESSSKCHSRAIDLSRSVTESSSVAPPEPKNTKSKSIALYTFTSGTTGMPKAVIISHLRYMNTVVTTNMFARMRRDDVFYVCLPLYHTNGLLIGVGQAIIFGITVALRKKFSVTHFWDDCIKFNCTGFIYIGEICRYLLAAAARPQDNRHTIRFMIGNGLRPLIWDQFINRFNIKQVAEFYGSSEGIGNMMNTENKKGAVGNVPYLWPKLNPVSLVRIDEETELPARDDRGRCFQIREPGVPGMHICKIMAQHSHLKFEGYNDSSSTNKKVISNVFQDGDRYYISGDVFIMDDELFFYFQDRTGDTFRWKGENVATTEVEQVVCDIVSLGDVAVYGVEIPGLEGKAGMVAIQDANGSINLKELYEGLDQRLPKYAKPIFVRCSRTLPLTDTFKIKKKQLRDESYNPNIVMDSLYYMDNHEKNYKPLTIDMYNKIISGSVQY